MPVHNADIADIFNRVADLLEIESDNPFRVTASSTRRGRRPWPVSKNFVPGSQFRLIMDAGHATLAKKPEEYRAIVEAFLEQVESRKP